MRHIMSKSLTSIAKIPIPVGKISCADAIKINRIMLTCWGWSYGKIKCREINYCLLPGGGVSASQVVGID